MVRALRGFVWVACMAAFLGAGEAAAKLDWTELRRVDLPGEPLDTAASRDGKTLFVLVPGEILVYALQENQVEGRIPVDPGFDRLSYSAARDSLILSSRTGRKVIFMRVEQIQEIDVSGLPHTGPADAPVTIAVFDDYQ